MEVILLEVVLLITIAALQIRSFLSTKLILKAQEAVFAVGKYHLVTGLFRNHQIAQSSKEFVQATLRSNHQLNYIRFFQAEEAIMGLGKQKDETEIKLIGGYYADEVFSEIQSDTNLYLVRNCNRSTDIKVIQDIADRHCQIKADMADSTLSLPLYYGLFGTIIGIIIGSWHISSQGADDAASVVDLLRTVALAMSVSGLGLALTVWNMSGQKNSNRIFEQGKNRFLNFVQTELLPEMRSDLQQSMHTMQLGLNRFNSTFQNSLIRFDQSIGTINENLELQRDFIEKLEQIGFTRMVKETSEIFMQLAESSKALKVFYQYQEGINTLLASLDNTVLKLQGLYDRSETFEQSLLLIATNIKNQEQTHQKLMDMLEQNSAEIQERKDGLRTVINEIDVFFREQYQALVSSVERHNQNLQKENDQQIAKIRESYDVLQKTIYTKTEEMKKMAEMEASLLEAAYRERRGLFDNLDRLPKIEQSLKGMQGKSGPEKSEELTKVLLQISTYLEQNTASKAPFLNWSAFQKYFVRNSEPQKDTGHEEKK